MRVSTAFNRMLDLDGATVRAVTFTSEGIVVDIHRTFRKLTCPHCGWSTAARYDRSVRRWRHLDAGASRLWLRAEIRRLDCRSCGKVVTEAVPWARHGARHTIDLQDVAAWMAQRAAKETVRRLLRISWEAVAHAVVKVVAEHLDGSRLDGLARIGVDEVSYRKGHRYLTVVADHDDDGAVVWAGEGRSSAVLASFYDELGEQRCADLDAVSLDLGPAYAKATREAAPDATQCADPFHVVALANKAVDQTRRWAWNQARKIDSSRARWVKHTRWALLKDPADLKDSQRAVIEQLRKNRSVLYRAYGMKEALRDIYRCEPEQAPDVLDAFLSWACRSRIPAFVKLSRTVRHERERILAAIELDLSNSKLEGTNSKIRLINHRGYGHHSATAIIAMIYLCCGGITVQLPTET